MGRRWVDASDGRLNISRWTRHSRGVNCADCDQACRFGGQISRYDADPPQRLFDRSALAVMLTVGVDTRSVGSRAAQGGTLCQVGLDGYSPGFRPYRGTGAGRGGAISPQRCAGGRYWAKNHRWENGASVSYGVGSVQRVTRTVVSPSTLVQPVSRVPEVRASAGIFPGLLVASARPCRPGRADPRITPQ